MVKSLKLGIVSLVIVSGLSICLAIVLFIAKEQEEEKRLLLERNLEKALETKVAIEKELEITTAAKVNLESETADLKSKAESLAQEAGKTKKQYESALNELRRKTEELLALKAEFESEKAKSEELNQKLAAIEKARDEIQAQLNELKGAKADLEKETEELAGEEGVKLERIIVKPESVSQGQVLVVNREFEFVVIDLGLGDGIKTGSILGVFKGDTLLGKVQAERVYDNMSTAIFLPESRKEEIDVGATVKIL